MAGKNLAYNQITSYLVPIGTSAVVMEMDASEAGTGFSALGNPVRLHIFRFLVQAGRDGAPIGTIHDHLAIPLSTLAHHLNMLVKAGLVDQQKDGRQVMCRANFDQMDRLVAYLTENCCAGIADADAATATAPVQGDA